MIIHTVGTRAQREAARADLLEREKQHTRLGDDLARRRRELPWIAVDKPYTLQTADGPKALAALFDGRSQLLIYHFMLGPSYEQAWVPAMDPAPRRVRRRAMTCEIIETGQQRLAARLELIAAEQEPGE
jgi:hypothetical protein